MPKTAKNSNVKPVNQGNSKKRSSRSKKGKSTSKKESLKASFTQLDRKDDTSSRVIYETERDPEWKQDKVVLITYWIMSKLQYLVLFYLFFAWMYQVFFGDPGMWKVYGIVYLMEVSIAFLIYLLNPRDNLINQYISSMSLIIQFIVVFHFFSSYLQSENEAHGFFDHVFGYSTLTLFLSILHTLILIESIEFLGETKSKTRDFSDEILVESTEKREQNLGKMVEELVDKILEDDGDFHVLFAIKDESGHRKSVEGTGVETKETRHFEMNSFGNMIELSRINTTVACVDARTDKKEDESTVEEEDTVDGVDSKFNSCLKQEKALSPMKIL